MSDKGLVLVLISRRFCLYHIEYVLQVTGVTGFVAGHVADQFLAAGYRVRGSVVLMFTGNSFVNPSPCSTTRGVKVKALADKVKRPGLEFVRVDDLIDSDLTEALKGMLFLHLWNIS